MNTALDDHEIARPLLAQSRPSEMRLAVTLPETTEANIPGRWHPQSLTHPKNEHMTRYYFHICLTAVVISTLAGSSLAQKVERDATDSDRGSLTRPNIVFLFADHQSTYSVGCYGNRDVRTPNMDQLAREGVIFDKHYNTTAICMASRAILHRNV